MTAPSCLRSLFRRASGFACRPAFGLAQLAAVFLAGAWLAQTAGAQVVINEIHYEPTDEETDEQGNCELTAFVELFNGGSDLVDLSGWRFSDGIDFVFPAGTSIDPGGFVVVAQEPSAVSKRYNITALGPWTGSLSNDGERVEFEDAGGNRIDEVDYDIDFPWPVSAAGEGGSMELINPSLDNDLGSSWRYSKGASALGEAVLIPPSSGGWRFRRGLSEASAPLSAWRQGDFVEDGTWEDAAMPIGFGGISTDDGTNLPLATEVADMQATYNSLYLRRAFTVAPGEIPQQLLVRFRSDDGAVIWINGVEVARYQVAAGVETFDGTANANAPSPEARWNEATVVGAGGLLNEGPNIVAVLAYNQSTASSDFVFDLELVRPAAPDPVAEPTPGRRNVTFATNAPPNIRQVRHTPEQPRGGEAAVITAKVTDPDGVASVVLHYQDNAPGRYIPAFLPHSPSVMTSGGFTSDRPKDPNPAFDDPANWTSVPMSDDGTGGDAVAGDGIFSATLPAFAHRHLIRYRITVTDAAGASVRVPFADDPSLNFAFFVYDGVPDYQADLSVAAGNGPKTHPASLLESFPVYHVVTREEDMRACIAYTGFQTPKGSEASRAFNWEGAFVYDGVVYDHINYRLRGANGRYQLQGKRSMKFKFNKGHYLAARDHDGRPYESKWRVLETAKMFSNRQVGNFGLVDSINNQLWNLVGLPAPRTHWFHFRVVDAPDEAPTQWSGDFWGMFLAIERYDVRFLEANDLEKGNLYKLSDGVGSAERQQRYQACGSVTEQADFRHAKAQIVAGKPEQFIRDHVNLERWYRFSAVKEAIRHYDWPSPSDKNMAWYFEPDFSAANSGYGKLWLLPYDHDDTWGPVWNSGFETVKSAVNNLQNIRTEERNVVRAFRDLVWQRDQIDPMIDALAARIREFVDADRDRWRNVSGRPSSTIADGVMDWGTLESKVEDMKRFAWEGGSWPGGSVGAGGRAAFLDQYVRDTSIPDRPTITYVGPAGFPINDLRFRSSAFADPQGAGSFGAMEWRLAEVTPLGGGTDTLIPAGASWRYLDNGSNQGDAWSQPGFDASSWPSAPAPLGYGGITDTQIATEIGFGDDPFDRHVTTYFRRTFTVEDPAIYESLTARVHSDDGVVVYINGSEAFRDGMPAGGIAFDTLATVAGNEGVFDEFAVPTALLVPGVNTIAVELHQQSLSSSDLVLDLELEAERSPLPPGGAIEYEWDAAWESGPLVAFGAEAEVPSAFVKPGRTYRARVRHMDDTQRWSHWSEPVEFVTAEVDVSAWADGLAVTEIMFNPADAIPAEIAAGFATSDFEFIEIANIGTVALDLTDVRFTKGIDFDFVGSAVTSLAPGARAVVVRNPAAFRSRYGDVVPVAGAWDPADRLANEGETIKLSFAGGVALREFDYDDDPPWPTAPDGAGYSLVLRNPAANPDHGIAANWRASVGIGGSPGGSDALGIDAWLGANGLAAGSEADDEDADGLANFVEFGTGSDPKSPGSGPSAVARVELVAATAGSLAEFRYRRSKQADGVRFSVEESVDAGQWHPFDGDVVAIEDNGDGTETVVVRARATAADFGPTRFLRLRIDLIP